MNNRSRLRKIFIASFIVCLLIFPLWLVSLLGANLEMNRWAALFVSVAFGTGIISFAQYRYKINPDPTKNSSSNLWAGYLIAGFIFVSALSAFF